MVRIGRIVMMGALAAALVLGVGCTQEPPEPEVEARVSPPAIKSAGVLVAGVDLSMPPFAGTDQGRDAGIDIDVASALAERLGVTVQFADVKPSEAATALAEGTADIVLSVPLASSDLSQLSLAGSYLTNGPAFFARSEGEASVEPSLTLSTVRTSPVGVQDQSESFWLLSHQLGASAVRPYPTLREALQALANGDTQLAAGDAIIGAYIARDFPAVQFAGQLGGGLPLAVAVAVDNTTLAELVRGELDALAADGVLDTIRRKWVGELPQIEVGSEETTSAP